MDPQQKLYEQGLVLMKHKRYDDALSRFEWALDYYAATDAGSAETWYRIGCCRSELAKRKIEGAEERLCAYEEFELYERAIEAYQKAIELQPDYTSARRFLAELFTYFGEMQSGRIKMIYLTGCRSLSGINKPLKFTLVLPIPITNWHRHTHS